MQYFQEEQSDSDYDYEANNDKLYSASTNQQKFLLDH